MIVLWIESGEMVPTVVEEARIAGYRCPDCREVRTTYYLGSVMYVCRRHGTARCQPRIRGRRLNLEFDIQTGKILSIQVPKTPRQRELFAWALNEARAFLAREAA